MSQDQMIHDIITRARIALQKAQVDADDTPRPVDACPAHDSQFALTKAISGALDTLLLMAQQNINDAPSEVPDGKLGAILATLNRPWPWAFASIAVFSPNIVSILSFLTGK
jgi:hypothetical protein